MEISLTGDTDTMAESEELEVEKSAAGRRWALLEKDNGTLSISNRSVESYRRCGSYSTVLIAG